MSNSLLLCARLLLVIAVILSTGGLIFAENRNCTGNIPDTTEQVGQGMHQDVETANNINHNFLMSQQLSNSFDEDLKTKLNATDQVTVGHRRHREAVQKQEDGEMMQTAEMYFRPLSRYRELLEESMNRTETETETETER